MALSFAPVVYKAVGTADLSQSTFKNPRHKMWGVFVRYPGSGSTQLDNAWKLVVQTNDIYTIKMYVNEYLKKSTDFPWWF